MHSVTNTLQQSPDACAASLDRVKLKWKIWPHRYRTPEFLSGRQEGTDPPFCLNPDRCIWSTRNFTSHLDLRAEVLPTQQK